MVPPNMHYQSQMYQENSLEGNPITPTIKTKRAMQSDSSNKVITQKKFTDECIEKLTLELGQDGLVSTADFAIFVSSLAKEPMQFYNLPISIQFKFVSLLCDGNNLDTCNNGVNQEQSKFGYNEGEYEKVEELCFDIFFDLKELGWIDSFEKIPSPIPSQSPSPEPSYIKTISPSLFSSANPSTISSESPSMFSSSKLPSSISFASPSSTPFLKERPSPSMIPSQIESNSPSIKVSIERNQTSSSQPSIAVSNAPSSALLSIPTIELTNSMHTSAPPTLRSNLSSSVSSSSPTLVESNLPSNTPSITSSNPPSPYPSKKYSNKPTLITSTQPSKNGIILPLDSSTGARQTLQPTPTQTEPIAPNINSNSPSQNNQQSVRPSSPTLTFTFAKGNEQISPGRGIGITGILIASCFVFGLIIFVMHRKKRKKRQWRNLPSTGKERSKSYFDFDFISLKSESNYDSEETSPDPKGINENHGVLNTFTSEQLNIIPQFNPSTGK